MTEYQKWMLERTITEIETKIDSYNRQKEKSRRKAIYDSACGCRESAQFSKGQEFTLEYVIEDLQDILQSLKEVQQ